VLERALGRRPIPMLVPRALPADSAPEETLLVHWLTGGRTEAVAAT
jgi:hypothetical protein